MDILNLGIDYGTIATLTAKTTIIELGEGSEQRNCEWNQCLLKFQIGERTLDNEEIAYLQAFHSARKGKLEAFLFKDWSDYKYQCSFVGDGIKTEFQLFKTYTVASSSVNRAIQFPKTITVFIDDVEQIEGFTVANLGILTFDTAPTGTIIVEGEFYVPVRFDQDDLKLRFNAIDKDNQEFILVGKDSQGENLYRLESRKIYTLESTTLTEVRLDNPLTADPIPVALNHIIDLGYDLDTLGGKSYNTTINPIAGGFEWRSQNWLNPKGVWDIGSRQLLRWELDYLIALFRVCRGRCVSFQYNDYGSENTYKVRFGEDAISFRFDAYEKGTERVIFNLSGMLLQECFASRIFSLEESSSFSFNLGTVFDGDYQRTVIAPDTVIDFVAANGGTIKAYLLSADYDNGFKSLQTGVELIGVTSGVFVNFNPPIYFGGGNSINVLIYQRASGPCYFSGVVRWEVWS